MLTRDEMNVSSIQVPFIVSSCGMNGWRIEEESFFFSLSLPWLLLYTSWFPHSLTNGITFFFEPQRNGEMKCPMVTLKSIETKISFTWHNKSWSAKNLNTSELTRWKILFSRATLLLSIAKVSEWVQTGNKGNNNGNWPEWKYHIEGFSF